MDLENNKMTKGKVIKKREAYKQAASQLHSKCMCDNKPTHLRA